MYETINFIINPIINDSINAGWIKMQNPTIINKLDNMFTERTLFISLRIGSFFVIFSIGIFSKIVVSPVIKFVCES